MKNYEILNLAELLNLNLSKLKDLKGAQFTYALLKNIDKIDKEVKIINESMKPTDEYAKYDKERVAMCEQHAKKDDKGNLLKKSMGNGQFEYDIDTESLAWLDDIAKLKTKYATEIEKRNEQIKSYSELLEIESDLELYKVKLDAVPNDISLELMNVIKMFVIE